LISIEILYVKGNRLEPDYGKKELKKAEAFLTLPSLFDK
jgi:hypothetical protein